MAADGDGPVVEIDIETAGLVWNCHDDTLPEDEAVVELTRRGVSPSLSRSTGRQGKEAEESEL